MTLAVAQLIQEGKIRKLLKITILGTSGSGKTSFLKMLFGEDIPISDVKRQHVIERKNDYAYTPLETSEMAETTISFNSIGAMVLFTLNNQMEFHEMHKGVNSVLRRDDIEYIMTFSIFDTAGQQRFEFMTDICVKGSDAIILFADGTNVSSIEYLTKYLTLVKQEEERLDQKIPIVIFINKADLDEKGYYLGSDHAEEILSEDYAIFETTVKDPDSFILPLRILIRKIQEAKNWP
ncbi:MAG: GTP-binding protein [Candidatus Heimdallarchaeota archaeon]|nr:GTP-binding protein [Candidatus Heimdallarchaeota archaeon]